jgi:hypothetical protein
MAASPFLTRLLSILESLEKLHTSSPGFKSWFGRSKVVDSEGKPLVVYHGTKRPDRIGDKFLKSRATSGPSAFFTDDPALASNYATNKNDTSLEVASYDEWFWYKNGGRNIPLSQSWHYLPYEVRQEFSEKIPNVGYRDEQVGADGGFSLGEGITGSQTWEMYSRESRGNMVLAAIEIWLNGGVLLGEEGLFLEVLKLAGFPVRFVKYDPPSAEYPGVIPVYLSIQTPLDASNVPESVVSALEQKAKRLKGPSRKYGADLWDKRTKIPQEWASHLREGESFSWTVIPDWVTEVLKDFGYDGVRDTGGKMGGNPHTVWIPFEPTQIKSVYNKGTFSQKKSILA